MTPSDPRAVGRRAPSAWNLPNYLTVGRFLLVPVFGWLLLAEGGHVWGYRLAALAVFSIAMVTDSIDGDLARRRGLVTDFGKVADPIADKALMGMALVGLSVIGLVPWWVTGVILLREVGITVMRFVVIRHGVMPAGRGGKAKTALQTAGVGLLIFPLESLPGGRCVAHRRLRGARRRPGRDRRHRRRLPRAGAAPGRHQRAYGSRARRPPDRPRAVSDLVARLGRRGETVGCAESLTGGLVVARLVDTPGASAVVRGGVVAYATEVKASLLGVDADLLAARGAVDPEVARQLALGARRVLGADWGVATTGVAGPDPQDGMPVGCVFVAVAGPGGGEVVVERHDLVGGRAQVRAGAVDAVLALLDRRLEATWRPGQATEGSADPTR